MILGSVKQEEKKLLPIRIMFQLPEEVTVLANNSAAVDSRMGGLRRVVTEMRQISSITRERVLCLPPTNVKGQAMVCHLNRINAGGKRLTGRKRNLGPADA